MNYLSTDEDTVLPIDCRVPASDVYELIERIRPIVGEYGLYVPSHNDDPIQDFSVIGTITELELVAQLDLGSFWGPMNNLSFRDAVVKQILSREEKRRERFDRENKGRMFKHRYETGIKCQFLGASLKPKRRKAAKQALRKAA